MVNTEISKVLATMRSISSEITPQPKPAEPGETQFSSVLKEAIGKVNEQQQAASTMVNEFQTGTGDASIAEVMVSTQKAGISFQAMNEVRNRLVEAYQEIMNMPI